MGVGNNFPGLSEESVLGELPGTAIWSPRTQGQVASGPEVSVLSQPLPRACQLCLVTELSAAVNQMLNHFS